MKHLGEDRNFLFGCWRVVACQGLAIAPMNAALLDMYKSACITQASRSNLIPVFLDPVKHVGIY